MPSCETSKCASSTMVIIADEMDFHISGVFVIEENCNSSALFAAVVLAVLEEEGEEDI